MKCGKKGSREINERALTRIQREAVVTWTRLKQPVSVASVYMNIL